VAAVCVTSLLFPVPSPGADKSTADHKKFEQLDGPFKTGPEVTEACLECHTEAAKQLHKTTHWTWAFENPVTGQELGKRNVINNFCVATATNWPRCTSCHIGYGWRDESFDLTSETRVDCLVCHDTTDSYRKFPTGAGHPAYEPKEFPPKSGKIWKPVDLAAVAQKVGPTSRNTCGRCHFYGGGGDGVKHGDLDSSMANPDQALDVHMDTEGLNFSCSTCHAKGGHEISGSRYLAQAVDTNGIDVPGRTDDSRSTCESCHDVAPHHEQKLNDHVDKVACQSCHIPEFARGGRKTKTYWDWSTAGKKNAENKPFKTKDADGYATFDTKKGDFVWEENVVPEYRWFDGEVQYTLLGETIDDQHTVPINGFGGAHDNPDSRIWPFKMMRGKQPYDSAQNILAIPHLFGKDETAFWKNFQWDKAIKTGLQARGVEFSGEYGFVDTVYYWPLSHMVAPKQEALGCGDCHSRAGRLTDLNGFYLPGRDRLDWLDRVGWGLVLLTLVGVVVHGGLRYLFWLRRGS